MIVGADARTVRPYNPIMGGLIRKMVDGTSPASLFYPAI